MWDQLENALAWYASAPSRWLESQKQDLTAAAEWIWTVLQGDFAEETTTAQTVTGIAVSMIPLVDQLCDLRDLVANVRKIREDIENKWAWFALALTLVGFFPGVGSLLKGCLKIVLAKMRRQIYRAGAKSLESDLWKTLKPAVEIGIQKFNQHLDKPAVRDALARLKIDNPYKYLAGQVRKLAGQVNVGQLLKALDGCISALNDLAGLVRRWGTQAMATKVGQMLQDVAEVRRVAAEKLRGVVQPGIHFLNCLARRFEIEADMSYRAYANVVNPHAFKRPTMSEEIEAMREELPPYVGKNVLKKYGGLEYAPVKNGWPDIGERAASPLTKAYETFHDIEPVVLRLGTVLYRVIDPKSFDDSACWMMFEEFQKLKNKSDWREKFAVWVNWNRNGEYVTYTVPPDQTLNVWMGKAASQDMGGKGGNFVLQGGGVQVVLDPKDMDRSYLGKRQPTSWGYDDLGSRVSLVGVPILTNNVRGNP